MQHVVVIGEADELPVRAKDVHMAAAAQRACGVGRSDIHRVKIAHLTVTGNDSLTMMKIIVPVCVRVFRAVDKDVFVLCGMNGHHANMRAVSGAIDHLHLTRSDIDPLNGFAGK